MKLKYYLEENNISYAAFAEMIGASSPMTAYRYAKGLRMPKEEIIAKITQATKGAVKKDDFQRDKKNRYVQNSAPEGGLRSRFGRILWDHLNAPLEFEDKSFDESSTEHPLPVARALAELPDRVKVTKTHYFLDGKPTRMREIIEIANKMRKQRGLSEILYPST